MSRYNPHHSNASHVFQAAVEFRQRCLIDQQSLLIPDKSIWTTQHFQNLMTHFVGQPDPGGGGFYEKLKSQLSTCEPLDVALMTEVFWIVQLPATNLGSARKFERLQEIWKIKPAAPFPVDSAFLKAPVLSGLGHGGPGYTRYAPIEMSFAIQAFTILIAMPRNERIRLLDGDGFEFAKWLQSVPAGKGRQLYHTLCHVLFPDSFERIFSQDNKNRVLRTHKIWTTSMAVDRALQDAALLELRKRLEVEFPESVDYYSDPVGTLMKNKSADPQMISSAPAAVDAGSAGSIADFDSSIETVDEDSDSASAPPRIADNVIFYGPPGTGKTHRMQERMQQAYDAGEDFEFLAFHPSYAYEEFVGGLRPSASKDGSGIVVTYEKGPFRKLCEQAHAAPSRRFTLFIDEINRANVAKVFGELITLIEPSKRAKAGSEPNEGEGAWIKLPGASDEAFSVPDNLDIVASMNTADRSVSTMDIALRRRFRFVECAPQPKLIKDSLALGSISLSRLLTMLNDRLEFMLDRNHAIGHAVFMSLDSLSELQDRIAERVIPLLQEYFFDDMDRVRLALTGHTKPSVFFTARTLSPTVLFPGGANFVGSESRVSLSISDRTKWSVADIVALYDTSKPIAPGDAQEAFTPKTELD